MVTQRTQMQITALVTPTEQRVDSLVRNVRPPRIAAKASMVATADCAVSFINTLFPLLSIKQRVHHAKLHPPMVPAVRSIVHFLESVQPLQPYAQPFAGAA